MMAEEKKLEALLKAYKKETDIGPDKDRLEQTIRLSKTLFTGTNRSRLHPIWSS